MKQKDILQQSLLSCFMSCFFFFDLFFFDLIITRDSMIESLTIQRMNVIVPIEEINNGTYIHEIE